MESLTTSISTPPRCAALPHPATRRPERRAYPRFAGDGVEITADPPITLIDLSPFGARLALPDPSPVATRLTLQIAVPAADLVEQVPAIVLARDRREVRVAFERPSADLQTWLLRLAKAARVRAAIASALAAAEPGGALLEVTDPAHRARIFAMFGRQAGAVTFDAHRAGRTLRGTLAQGPRLVVDLALPIHLPRLVRCLIVSGHDTFVLEAATVARGPRQVALEPGRLVRSDRRRSPRRVPERPLALQIDAVAWPVVDLSVDGVAIECPDPPERPCVARLVGPDGLVEVGTVLFTAPRIGPEGRPVAGAAWIDPHTEPHPGPTPEVRLAPPPTRPIRCPAAIPAAQITLEVPGGRLAARWTQTAPEPKTVIVVPPAWAKSTASTALMAAFIAASAAQSGEAVAILRFDYRDSVGESTGHPQARMAGREALMLRPSSCVADICAALEHACTRAPGAARVMLIGMSFSGPLCLRAAARSPRVTHLIQYMGASDIHDLTRTASGGVDFVNRHRAGLDGGLDTMLGQLTATGIWCADGLERRLLFLLDAQRDAARLRIPILWIEGAHDAFVSPARIGRVLAASRSPAAERVRVPYGHIPGRSADAVAAMSPLVEWLLRAAGVAPCLALPEDGPLAAAIEAEWAATPSAQLPEPKDLWRTYMLGVGDEELGFDVLAMTAEYAALITLQVEALAPPAGGVIVDLGGGPGHALPCLAARAPDLRVHLFDLVDVLVERAGGRAAGLDVTRATWDADRDALPAVIAEADGVLLSLFLSCIADPPRLLEALFAALRPGAVVVASSILPDADLSQVYVDLLRDLAAGTFEVPDGMTRDFLAEAVRSYMSSAAWILRLAEVGALRLYTGAALRDLLSAAGFAVDPPIETMGTPARATVVRAVKGGAR